MWGWNHTGGGRDRIIKAGRESVRNRMVTSPCINVCTVENGVCTACNRTLGDIARWGQMTEQERTERMQEIEASTDSC